MEHDLTLFAGASWLCIGSVSLIGIYAMRRLWRVAASGGVAAGAARRPTTNPSAGETIRASGITSRRPQR
jgi:hypothetical protein